MTKSLKSRIALLEEIHQRGRLAEDTSGQQHGEAAIEKVQQILSELGVEQAPTESLAETLARALEIGTDDLRRHLDEAAYGHAASIRRVPSLAR